MVFLCTNVLFIIITHLYSLLLATSGNNRVSVSLALFCRDYPVITIRHGLSEQQSPPPNWVALHSVWPEGFLFVSTTGTGRNAVWERERGSWGFRSKPTVPLHWLWESYCSSNLLQICSLRQEDGLTMRARMTAATQAAITLLPRICVGAKVMAENSPSKHQCSRHKRQSTSIMNDHLTCFLQQHFFQIQDVFFFCFF